jgi:hypothetical protein
LPQFLHKDEDGWMKMAEKWSVFDPPGFRISGSTFLNSSPVLVLMTAENSQNLYKWYLNKKLYKLFRRIESCLQIQCLSYFSFWHLIKKLFN